MAQGKSAKMDESLNKCRVNSSLAHACRRVKTAIRFAMPDMADISVPKANCGEAGGRANDPHKLTKAAERWLGGGAASGGSKTRGGMAGAHRSLRGKRQSRRPPRRVRPPRRAAFAA